jgi:uncharacterized protein (DUF433 family)
VQDVPGVVYSPPEDRARIQGTGVEPWMIAQTFEVANGDWDVVGQTFDWLSEDQLRAAMAFNETNLEMTRERIDAENDIDIEAFWRKYPQTAPKRRIRGFISTRICLTL